MYFIFVAMIYFVKAINQARLDQQKALKRLNYLEDWHRKVKGETSAHVAKAGNRSIAQVDLSHQNLLQETRAISTNNNSTVNSSNPRSQKPPSKYQFTDFDKIYDPYKVILTYIFFLSPV